MTNSIIDKKIEKIIPPVLEEKGYRLVLHKFKGNTLQFLAERLDNVPISIDECVQIGRVVSPILEEYELCSDSCNLEVSSAGIDRPLVMLEDFAKFLGHKAKVELISPVNKKKKFTGVIESMENTTINFVSKKENYNVEFENIKFAQLVITNELIEFQRSLIPSEMPDEK